jgi:hypothetical protein
MEEHSFFDTKLTFQVQSEGLKQLAGEERDVLVNFCSPNILSGGFS